MKSIREYIYEREVGSTVVLTPGNLSMSLEAFHEAVSPFVKEGSGDGFIVTHSHDESHSGYRGLMVDWVAMTSSGANGWIKARG